MPSSAMCRAQRSALDVPAHPHLTPRPVVLDGVAEQVDEHLAQADAVGADEDLGPGDRAARSEVALEPGDQGLDADAGGQRHHHRQRVLDRRAKVDRFERDRHLARFHARQVEHVVHQRQQVPAGVLDVLDAGELLQRGRFDGVEPEQLREAEDGIERRAQLVAHARQELGLRPARRLQRLACLALGPGRLQPGHVAQHRRQERAALGLVAGEGDLERELLAVGTAAEQLAHLAAVDVAELQLLRPGRFRGARPARNEAVDRAADRFGRRRAEQALGGAIEEHDLAFGVDRDDAVVDRVDEAGHADLALAQRGLHVQPLGDVEERRHRALQRAVVPHRMRPVLDREGAAVAPPEELAGDVQLARLAVRPGDARVGGRCTPFGGPMDQRLHLAAEQVRLPLVAEHGERRPVDEGAAALGVDTVEALGGGIEQALQRFAAAPHLVLGGRLDPGAVSDEGEAARGRARRRGRGSGRAEVAGSGGRRRRARSRTETSAASAGC